MWGLRWDIQETEAGVLYTQWGHHEHYRNYVTFDYDKGDAVTIFVNDPRGLSICERIAQIALDSDVKHPIFDWLL